jgi:hypothetical protein
MEEKTYSAFESAHPQSASLLVCLPQVAIVRDTFASP